jgi:uncharacterized protein (DUF302 family)
LEFCRDIIHVDQPSIYTFVEVNDALFELLRVFEVFGRAVLKLNNALKTQVNNFDNFSLIYFCFFLGKEHAISQSEIYLALQFPVYIVV